MAITTDKKRTVHAKHGMYTPKFILICLGSLFFSASYNMLIPELPAYLSDLGGAQYIGLIIALFTLTAGISRPFSGKLTDTIGRKPVMIFGAVVCLVCGCFLSYFNHDLWLFVVAIASWVFNRVYPNSNSYFCFRCGATKKIGRSYGGYKALPLARVWPWDRHWEA